MEEDTFKEVSGHEIPKILSVLKKNCPRHFLLYQYVTIMDSLKKKGSQLKQYLYRNGSVEEGIYLIQTVCSTYPDQLSLFFVYTMSNDSSALYNALANTSRIPWQSKGYIFEVTVNRFTPVLGKTFVSKRLQCIVQHYSLMWLPHDVEVREPKVPTGTYLSCLKENHVPEVASNWPSFPGSEQFLEKEMLSCFGLGLFNKSSEKLLSSALIYHSGGIFMLYTEPEARRKGYGDIIIRHLVIEIRRRDWIPFCTVFSDNIPSLKLIKKIGFTEFDKADYIFPSQFFQQVSDAQNQN